MARTPERWVEKGPLAPWMIAYAKWLVGQPQAELTTEGQNGYRGRYPTGEERSRRCSEFAGRTVQRTLVPLLEKRQDFRDYFGKLRDDAAFQAKERGRDIVAPYFEARQKGLDKALGKKTDPKTGKVTWDENAVDHREIERYTRPIIDLAFPKKETEQPQVQKFTINLFGASPEQKKLLLKAVTEEEPDTIDYEIIESEKTTEEDE